MKKLEKITTNSLYITISIIDIIREEHYEKFDPEFTTEIDTQLNALYITKTILQNIVTERFIKESKINKETK